MRSNYSFRIKKGKDRKQIGGASSSSSSSLTEIKKKMAAYMCTDSGNLMAIAQQVIKQKQQQQQRHQHQQQQQNQEPIIIPSIEVASSDADPFASSSSSSVPPQWGNQQQQQEQELEHTPIRGDHFPFALPEPPFLDPFGAGVLGFPPPPPHLDNPPFRISEFDSDEWMDSLIGDSPTESSEIMADVWQGSDLPPIFTDAFASCSTTISLPSQVSTSDLDRIVFPDSCKIVTPHHSLSFDPPPPKKEAEAEAEAEAESKSPPLLFKSLVDCARIVDSDPDLAAKAIERIRDLASDLGDPTERVAFYFSEALNRRLTGASAPDFQEEEIALYFRAFNEACPYSIFVHLTANQANLKTWNRLKAPSSCTILSLKTSSAGWVRA